MINTARALTIAGSDSGGCAGIQADLKTFGALGVHGMSALTAVTAQDTRHVHAVTNLPAEVVEAQIRAVIEDIGVDAVKTGMLSTADNIARVSSLLAEFGIKNAVVDPVMVSTAGDPLIDQAAVDVLKDDLFPRALIVTPNLREAQILCGADSGILDPRGMAREILKLGPRSVVIKGGHSPDADWSEDCFWDGQRWRTFKTRRVDTSDTHGSGCTYSSAIAAFLALGCTLIEALCEAKAYVFGAIDNSLRIGKGHGPLGHFHRSWPRQRGIREGIDG